MIPVLAELSADGIEKVFLALAAALVALNTFVNTLLALKNNRKIAENTSITRQAARAADVAAEVSAEGNRQLDNVAQRVVAVEKKVNDSLRGS